ncbi:MAG: hypothetical protein IJT04_03630 [Bacteroidales bacterium]|nr:hypothetical protein [Bacteroidales bacterium]
MRKIFLLSTIVMACLLMVSCNKEGQFNPKSKIDKIYYSCNDKYDEVNDYGDWETVDEGVLPKYVCEIWNWDGNVLKSITHYDYDGEFDYSETFVYEGKSLVSIVTGVAERWTLNYEKGKLSLMEYYSDNERLYSYEFTHDKGKISEIIVTSFGSKKSVMTKFPVSVLRFFIPAANTEALIKAIAKINEKNTTKEVYTYNIKLEWSGKNVSKATYIDGAYTNTYEYTYDEKMNPYYGLFDLERFDFEDLLSKNNITRCVKRDFDDYYECNYIYTYKGKVPTMQTYTNTDYNYSLGYRYTVTNNYYFEYK